MADRADAPSRVRINLGDRTPPATYFWVMTVQPTQQAPGTVALATLKGTFTPLPGETREDSYQKISDYVADQLVQRGHLATYNVLFYSFEPNQL